MQEERRQTADSHLSLQTRQLWPQASLSWWGSFHLEQRCQTQLQMGPKFKAGLRGADNIFRTG